MRTIDFQCPLSFVYFLGVTRYVYNGLRVFFYILSTFDHVAKCSKEMLSHLTCLYSNIYITHILECCYKGSIELIKVKLDKIEVVDEGKIRFKI